MLISRTQFRVQMNKADQEAGNKAVDSLINYETVKVSRNTEHLLTRKRFFIKPLPH